MNNVHIVRSIKCLHTLINLFIQFFSQHAIEKGAIVAIFIAAPAMSYAQESKIFTLTGSAAANYIMPSDMTLIRTLPMARFNLSYERYQQSYEGAKVLGGQITLHRDTAGHVLRVIGAHYPDITPRNSARISAAGAHALASHDIGPDGTRKTTLMINPNSGQIFWRVETQRATSRWIHWIGAENGTTINKFNALANQCTTDCGYGAAYNRDPVFYSNDLKNLAGLITPSGSSTQLVTADGRQKTYDQGSSRRPFLGPIAIHNDNIWDISGRESPGTGALVDAHYYVALADTYFKNQYGFDFTAPTNYNKPIDVHAHFTKNYVNAFWNGNYLAFGDGDGVNYGPLTSMDVAAHEFTHSVTEATSNLIYQNESGALNESFSDIMAAVIEKRADSSIPAAEPDLNLALPGSEWLVGEDFDLVGDGFRNMANPGADGDPSHYHDRYTGTSDNGGVHINSGISNYTFYLLVERYGVDIQAAADIFYMAYTALPTDAVFCDARDATISMAGAQVLEVTNSWNDVGVDAALCDGVQVDAPPTASFSANCSNLDCTFTDTSTDDGSITIWSWNFGDGNTVTDQSPSHSYAVSGSYSVSLTVTDNASPAQQDIVSNEVTVNVASSGGIGLSAETFKVKGVRWATLTWSNASNSNVDIYLDNTLTETVTTDTSPYDFLVGGKGGGRFSVQVCETGTNTCSPTVIIIY